MIEQGTTLSEKQKDWFAIAAILGILLIRFCNTILFNHPISKVFLTAHWDSLFYPLKAGQNFNMDCSLADLFMPYRFFVADLWHLGLPLWNQLNGFGMPLLADPQALPFSPLYALFTLYPSMYTWNVLLIVQLGFAAICIYFLSREIQLSFVAGLIAALVFMFCPYLQWQIETLGTGFCLVPFLFLFFTRMANKGSFWNVVLAGFAAAIDILSAHPEIAFVTILFASIWTGFCCYIKDPLSMLSWLRVAAVRLALAGIVAFGLCAPMLIPFGEYVANGESYKLDTIAAAGLSWQAILANYLFPFQPKASIFFGPLALWGSIASFVFFNKHTPIAKPLIICFLISLIGVIRPFPFNFIFSIPPLSMTFATYWLPEYFLFLSILAGLGCSYLVDELFNDNLTKNKKRIFALTIIGGLFLAVPFFYSQWHTNAVPLVFDQTFEKPHFNLKVWISNASFAILALSALILTVNRSLNFKIIASALFVIIGFASLFVLSFNALPIRPAFAYPARLSYPDNQPIIANERSDRILSLGRHLFVPNNNLIYRLPSLRSLNPIFPKGFIEFTKACGAETDQYTQIFSPTMSPLLSLAGVTKIISEQPILDQSVLEVTKSTPLSSTVKRARSKRKISRIKEPQQTNANFENLISLNNVEILRDDTGSSIFLKAKPDLHLPEDFLICLYIEDAAGKPTTYIEPVLVSSKSSNQDIICSARIPSSDTNWSIAIRIMRYKTLSFLIPTKTSLGTSRSDKSWLIANSKETNRFAKINNARFELLSQHGTILEYKDKAAFNRYFFVENIAWASDNAAALKYLKQHTNQLANTAVLENKDKDTFDSTMKTTFKDCKETTALTSVSIDPGSIKEAVSSPQSPINTSTDFSLETETKKPSFLVGSDIYYPGWNVFIDGKPSKIFRTDYLYRGIIIPAGKHLIRFAYQPLSLTIGLWLFFITIEIIIVLALKHHYFSRGKELTFQKAVAIKV